MVVRWYVEYFNQVVRDPKIGSLMKYVSDVGLCAFLACRDKYCISPVLSKVRNYGFDGSGAYCENTIGVKGGYDYQTQEIDTSEHFDIVMNDSRFIRDNTIKLSGFQKVSKRALRLAKFNFFIIKYFGLSFGRQSHKIMLTMLKAIGLKKRI